MSSWPRIPTGAPWPNSWPKRGWRWAGRRDSCPSASDVTACIHALGFATRVALSFGGAQPGDYSRILRYNKNRVFAFVLAFGPVDDEKHAQAAGAINFGFPTISETDIDQILPTGICTYEHVVSPVPADRIVAKAIEVRGLKITIAKVPVPVPFGPAFQGERVRKEEMYVEMAGQVRPGFELLMTRDLSSRSKTGRSTSSGPRSTTSPRAARFRSPSGSRWPAGKCSRTSSPSWNARFTTS